MSERSLTVEDRYQREIGRYQVYHVAVTDNRVVACSWLESADSVEADCEIIALYVRYGIRGNGIDRRLLLDAKDYFIRARKKKMIIWYQMFCQLDEETDFLMYE